MCRCLVVSSLEAAGGNSVIVPSLPGCFSNGG